ncbi:AvrRpt-cleavage domain-containing protein [Cephalotus follicularis]|uniref:AvrRpt-cleavage domain-containing protein n=1 Tax=Cephalotus follicularis TaxID=3775 RepID=A0A1Q3BS61_CEPFO|nr:AvrRpt-cleavage domain-containing protein [Cephalotus follicularis]
MTQRSHVPRFGNWDGEENVPYTAYFDKARKGRNAGKLINPNDPEENPDLFAEYGSPNGPPPSRVRAETEEPIGQGAAGRTHESRKSREEVDLKQFSSSPAHRASNESNPQRPGGRGVTSAEGYRRPARPSAGSENSMERSPLHPQAKISGRGGGGAPSPAWEGKNSYDGSHGTPGRSRLRPRGDESPEKGAAVPKFGAWDENNPASADGFTHIFNKVREERNGGGNVPGISTASPYPNVRKPTPNESSSSCCFPWSRK